MCSRRLVALCRYVANSATGTPTWPAMKASTAAGGVSCTSSTRPGKRMRASGARSPRFCQARRLRDRRPPQRERLRRQGRPHRCRSLRLVRLTQYSSLSCPGGARSTIDLVQTLQSLQAWNVSVLAISGFQSVHAARQNDRVGDGRAGATVYGSHGRRRRSASRTRSSFLF